MVGETVSHYRILDKLGGGGMGVIYEAEDTRLGRRVALKFIPENMAGDKKSLERFEREARAASQLVHPNICTIHDIDDNEGHPFIVMEKLEGLSLKQRIHQSGLNLTEAIDIAVQVANALEALHAKGIIHRDIKPGNIFLSQDGPVKVLDFGLAKFAGTRPPAISEDTPQEDSLTAVGVVPGTAVYMSPEQARNEEIDARSDLFSLGVVLYEMVTGRKPFHGKNVVTTLDAVLHQKPKSPLAFNPSIPPELVGIIGHALEKNPRRRYQNAAELNADLEQLRSDLTPGKVHTGITRPRLRLVTDTFEGSPRRLVFLLVAVSAVLFTIVLSGGIWWLRHRDGMFGSGSNSIAVMPLTNLNRDKRLDYLRFALADEISNTLTEVRTLDVRPSAETQQYFMTEKSTRQIGEELHVAQLVGGHFLRQGDRLIITLESIDVRTNTLIWQSTIETPYNNLALAQARVAGEIRQGLLRKLGILPEGKRQGKLERRRPIPFASGILWQASNLGYTT